MSFRLAVLFTSAIATVSVGFTIWAYSRSAALGRPPLQVSPVKVDLGTVFVKERKDFEVTLRNVEAEPVEVSELITGCSCVNAEVEPASLAPGEAARLRGTFSGKGKSGTFHEKLLVHVKSPTNCALLIPISGVVKRRIEVLPERLEVTPDFVKNTQGKGSIVVHNGSDEHIELRLPQKLPPGIRFSLKHQELAPGESARVEVAASFESPVITEYPLHLECSHSIEGKLDFTLAVRPVDGIAISPKEVVCGVRSKKELSSRTERLAVQGGLIETSTVKEVQVPDFLAISSTKHEEHSTVLFVFKFRDAFARGADLASEIIVVFNHTPTGRSFRLVVPVSGFVSDAFSEGRKDASPQVKLSLKDGGVPCYEGKSHCRWGGSHWWLWS